MNIINIYNLYRYNYSVNVVNSLRQTWYRRNIFSCIGHPKDRDMLCYLDNCDAEYTLKSGEKLWAKSGNIVYIPIGSEYTVRLYAFQNEQAGTVGINFYMYDENGEPFIMSNKITVFQNTDCKYIVDKINNACESLVPCYGRMKSGVYEIISILSEKQKTGKRFMIIEKGIKYLENDIMGELSISDISKMCNVSEIYFRKLFKEYSGYSPIEYRLRARLEKAKIYLEYDNLNVVEIADLLNFTNSAYFCKQFKAYTGLTPMEFRKQTNN